MALVDNEGWRLELSDWELAFPTRGENTAFRVLQMPKISSKKVFHLPTEG